LSRTVCEGIDLTQNRMAHASQLVGGSAVDHLSQQNSRERQER
jgi:hypothetical protein